MVNRESAARISARSALAGDVATGAMSALMLALQKAGRLGTVPPRKISERLLAVALRRWPHPQKMESRSEW